MEPAYSDNTAPELRHRYAISRATWAAIRLRRFVYQNRTNAPFLSGDGFASLADYYPFGKSGSETVNSQLLSKAKVIFVNSERLECLLEEYFEVLSPLVLITGNSDFNWVSLPSLPSTVNLWLCQNAAAEDSRILTLPIGIENLSLGRRGRPRFFREFEGERILEKVFVPPMSNTNRIRPEIVREAVMRPEIFAVSLNYVPEKDYFRLARKYRFVLCLEGNGYENHRIWETLYFGNFPILLETPWSRSLRYLNLPILTVRSLEEIEPKLLENFESRNSDFRPTNAPALWLGYWQNLITASSTKTTE